MHRGVARLLRWIDENRDARGLSLRPAASAAEISALEHALGAPLPADLRLVLSRFNGGQLPTGTLLSAGTGPGTMHEALRRFAEREGLDFLDPEVPLPFLRTDEESLLVFDRSSGPVPDTWSIDDYYEPTRERRLVHRTFDGWCRVAVDTWSVPDDGEGFTLEKYLAQGRRHVEIEPDVCTAHATLAHALRRSGDPEGALESYLRAARCVPSLPHCEWEALKLAALLRRDAEALEAARRVCARGPDSRWQARGVSPGRVADVVARLAARAPDLEPWLALMDTLCEEAPAGPERDHAFAVRRALCTSSALPPPWARDAMPVVAPRPDLGAWWSEAADAYREGRLRDEDLLLDASLEPLGQYRPLSDLLRIRREF
ncbi:MAG: SMI1/KNR4 family protein [Myxococcota bacterium]|nr:SMI1/KNR4 family protein [Myxococcota bacterium]MDW8360946.1 SMI1/KNR4 family protein [Myxococcales bacterium]